MKTACKVLCIIIVVLFVLAIAAGTFLALYSPKAEKLAKKLSSDELTVIYYEEGKTEYSTNIKNLISFVNDNFTTEMNIKEVVEFSSKDLSEDDKDYVEGYVFYLDKLGSTFKLCREYIKYIRNTESEDASALKLHFSPRGKALFIGNVNAEIEFRKIIF